MRQKNEREDQGEGVEDSGKTGTGVRGRDTSLKKVQEKTLDVTDVWMLEGIRNEGIGRTTKFGRSQGIPRLKCHGNVMRREEDYVRRAMQVEVQGRGKRGRLCKEGDASGSTGEREERKTM